MARARLPLTLRRARARHGNAASPTRRQRMDFQLKKAAASLDPDSLEAL